MKIKTQIAGIPSGTYKAVCTAVVDLGTQATVWMGVERKVKQMLILFEGVDEHGLRFSICTNRLTQSLSRNSRLRALLTSWRGREFTDLEVLEFDTDSLLGVPCMLNIIRVTKPKGERSEINSIMRMPKGVPPLTPTSVWSYCIERDRTNFPPEMRKLGWLVEAVMKSDELSGTAPSVKMAVGSKGMDALPADAANIPNRPAMQKPAAPLVDDNDDDDLPDVLRNMPINAMGDIDDIGDVPGAADEDEPF